MMTMKVVVFVVVLAVAAVASLVVLVDEWRDAEDDDNG
jgi:1,4-dihydroxy-2-naphthoate octaprenyltransferase